MLEVLLISALTALLAWVYYTGRRNALDQAAKDSLVNVITEKNFRQKEALNAKNEYIKNLERTLLDNASPALVTDILNGLFAEDQDSLRADELHNNRDTD